MLNKNDTIYMHEPMTAPPKKEVEVSLLGEDARTTEEFTIR